MPSGSRVPRGGSWTRRCRYCEWSSSMVRGRPQDDAGQGSAPARRGVLGSRGTVRPRCTSSWALLPGRCGSTRRGARARRRPRPGGRRSRLQVSGSLELFPGDAAGDVLDLGRGQGGGALLYRLAQQTPNQRGGRDAVSYTHLTLPTNREV